MPKSWIEFKIDWKASWDETLTANGNEELWRQALAKDLALQRAADEIQNLRRAWLLEQMIGHFSKESDKCAAACRRIADTYLSLGDRTRAANWFKKLAEDFPKRADRAEAYAGILRAVDPYDAIPAARDWVDYAVDGLDAMIKSGALPRDDATVLLAQQQAYALLIDGRRYEDARRFLDRVDPEPKNPRWQLARALLMEVTGQRDAAADLYEAAGDEVKAETLRTVTAQASIDGVGKPIPRDLEIRWNAIEAKRQGGKSPLEDLGLMQQTLKLSAEADSIWQAGPSHRVLCWLAIDQLLQSIKPAEMKPFRKFQERTAAVLVRQLGPGADVDAVQHLFRTYPWSASVHKLLIESGEISLRANRNDEAFRAFQHVITYSDDPQLTGQANVGLWFAMTELAEPREAIEELMAAVPDSAMLAWRGEKMTAAAVKDIMRKQLPASAVALPPLARLQRPKIALPVELATDAPLPKGVNAAPQGLGALAVRRIEQSEDGLYFFGPRHVVCYDIKTMKRRWLQVGNKFLDAPDAALGTSGALGSEDAWRPVSLGSHRSSAIAPRRSPRPGEAVAPKAVYSLLFHNLREGTQCDVAAFDAQNGEVLWRTGGSDEWRDLEPLSEPAAAEGRVYIVAWNLHAVPPCPVYLVCLDGDNGSTMWTQMLGNAAPEAKQQRRSLLSSSVTVYRGSVYVSTNMGLLARCDARDGAIEWARTYPSVQQSDRPLEQLRREGTSPLVVGERVFVAPRDHSGVIAIDREVGQLLWEVPLVPSEQIVGAAGTALIIRGNNELAALDLVSGKEMWARTVNEASGARTAVFGPDVFEVSDARLLRITAATGATVEELALDRAPGAAHVLLPDGALAQVSVEPVPVPPGNPPRAIKPPMPTLAEDWKLPIANARLVMAPNGSGPPNTFGVLADRRFLCVTTKPQTSITWQTLLRDGADSIGFHGELVIVARGALLTAMDATSGVTRWTHRLPFQPQVVGGDARVLFAGELSPSGKVVSIDPETGSTHWYRWFGEEARLGDGPLAWISMRDNSSGPPTLILYWQKALFGKEGWRPGEMIVDAVSGTIQELRPFLPDERGWPARIVFGDSPRTYVGKQPFPLRAYQASFRSDAVAFAGDKHVAHLVLSENSTDLSAGWSRVLDLSNQPRYDGAIGLYATASGLYVKQLVQLFHYDAAAQRETTYNIPISADMLDARTILDLREQDDALIVISQEPGQPVKHDPRGRTIGGLQDNTGKGKKGKSKKGGDEPNDNGEPNEDGEPSENAAIEPVLAQNKPGRINPDPKPGERTFEKTKVEGRLPAGTDSTWTSLSGKQRNALSENFARELPREFRDMLKVYYEELSK